MIAAASIAITAACVATLQPERVTVTAPRGLTGRATFTYAGPPLRAKPDQDPAAPIVIRLSEGEPLGDGRYRYRVDFIGTVVGQFELAELIEHRDGTRAPNLPSVLATIESELPPGHGSDLFLPEQSSFALSGHYRLLLGAFVAAWLLVPVVVVVRRRLRRPRPEVVLPSAPPPTLADQLRPLVEAAMSDGLSPREQGRLELLLLMFWRERLGLGGLAPHDAIARLRAEPTAGRLLVAVERWLHARGGASPRVEADVAELLEPYRSTPAIAAEGAP